MERKGLFLSAVLAVFFLFSFSVEARPLPEVSKKAKAEMLLSIKVSKESRGKVRTKSGQKAAYDYSFQVNFLNQGDKPLLWDNCLGLIICEQGRSLLLRVSMYAEPGAERGRQKIAPGESLKFTFSTKGYTDELVASRGKGDMLFVIALEQEGEAAYGPSGVFVPRLDELSVKEKGRDLPLIEI